MRVGKRPRHSPCPINAFIVMKETRKSKHYKIITNFKIAVKKVNKGKGDAFSIRYLGAVAGGGRGMLKRWDCKYEKEPAVRVEAREFLAERTVFAKACRQEGA